MTMHMMNKYLNIPYEDIRQTIELAKVEKDKSLKAYLVQLIRDNGYVLTKCSDGKRRWVRDYIFYSVREKPILRGACLKKHEEKQKRKYAN